MKKLLMMFALVGAFAVASCSADKETQEKQNEAQEKAKDEAGDMPKFDENGNPIDDTKKATEEPKKDTVKVDTAKKVETKKEEPKK
ncbi:MAG: hypothetical protein MUC49_04440 [Raineya sp.]|jgi:hypothetical protein|nr:hypothetical protein [Raineya sp.]